MLDILSKFKGVTPFKGITIDDGWDQLNRSFMFVLLVVMGTTVTIRQYTGSVISCDGFKKFGSTFAEDYCWTQGLYTIAEGYDLPYYNAPYPGIIPEESPPCRPVKLRDGTTLQCPPADHYLPPTRIYHLWYQWVPFYFWLAAAAFFMPYLLYKNFGMGDIKPLVRLLHNPVESDAELRKMTDKAATWLFYKFDLYMSEQSLLASMTRKHGLGLSMVFVKILYAAVSFGCFILTAEMFSIGDFKTYGTEWIEMMKVGQNYTTEVKDKLFPKMVACEVKRWGASGIEEEQGMCVLAPNVINQYLFLILWFCLVFVMACNILSIFAALIKLLFTYGSYRRLLSTAFLRDDSAIKHMYFSVGSSGRLILHVLASNTAPRVFEDILTTLAPKLIQRKLRGNGKAV